MFNRIETYCPSKNILPFKYKNTWTDCGNGIELLALQQEEKKKEEEKELQAVLLNSHNACIKKNDVAFFTKINGEMSKKTALIKIGDEIIRESISTLQKEIPIQICIIENLKSHIILLQVDGEASFDLLTQMINSSLPFSPAKYTWIFNGQKVASETTVKNLGLCPNDKILLLKKKFEIKIFERFLETSGKYGWNLNNTEPDAIIFKCKKRIYIAGFGMYGIKEGFEKYQILFELKINGEDIVSRNVWIDTPATKDKIQQVFFYEDCSFIEVKSGSEITIIVRYIECELNSSLWMGVGGICYNDIEGNLKDLFEIKNCPLCSSSSTVEEGQIPELYYDLPENQWKSSIHLIL